VKAPPPQFVHFVSSYSADDLWNTECGWSPSDYPGAAKGHMHTYIHTHIRAGDIPS
jgi:hypothetical protein